MKNYSDIVSIFGGLLAVVSVLVTAGLSTVPGLSSDLLALLFVGGLFTGFIICLAGFAFAQFGSQTKATGYAA
jgi:hypothetical protein